MAQWVILGFVGMIVLAALARRVPLFDAFCEGVKEGGAAALRVFPTLLALMTAVAMLRASGVLDCVTVWLRPVAERVGFPTEVLPSALLRPLSGSGSLAALQDVLAQHGADCKAGLVASVLQSSTETTFYTLSVYFGYVGVKKAGCALPAALVGDLTGMVLSALTVHLFF